MKFIILYFYTINKNKNNKVMKINLSIIGFNKYQNVPCNNNINMPLNLFTVAMSLWGRAKLWASGYRNKTKAPVICFCQGSPGFVSKISCFHTVPSVVNHNLVL